MVALNTTQGNFGFIAKDFDLLGVDNEYYNLDKCSGKNGLIVMFICNHCPYVQSIISNLVSVIDLLKKDYQVNTVAIMPNDVIEYPEDSYENMVNFARENKFTFPYLIDSAQEVAKEYGAICTPDFFGFNSSLNLCYRGRFNDAKKDKSYNSVAQDSDLFQAMKFVAETGNPPDNQASSVGCSIKWSNSKG